VVAVYGRVIDSGTFEIEDWVRKGSRAFEKQFLIMPRLFEQRKYEKFAQKWPKI